MNRDSVIRVGSAIAAIGSLVTPAVSLFEVATGPVSAADLADARATTGVEVTADTVRSNHVVAGVAVLGAYVVLAAVFWWSAHRSTRGGRIAPVVASMAWVVGAVVWSGSALDGAAGWVLRGVVTGAGLIAVIAAVSRSRRAEAAATTDAGTPLVGTGIRSHRRG